MRFLVWVIELVVQLIGNSQRMRERKLVLGVVLETHTQNLTLNYLILTSITVVHNITFLKLFTLKKNGY